MRVLRGIGVSLVACLAAASVLAVVVPGQAGAADPPPPKKFVTGWLPYWNTAAATKSVVDNANVFQDASPFVFDANSRTDIALTANADEWRHMRRALRGAGIANIPTVATELTADQFAWIIKNPDRRAAHARALAKVVDRYNLDGIDLDYESINFGSSYCEGNGAEVLPRADPGPERQTRPVGCSHVGDGCRAHFEHRPELVGVQLPGARSPS